MGFDISYSYDEAGNRITKTEVTGATSVITTYTYDDANRLQSANRAGQVTSYQHDVAGNRTQVTDPDGVNSYYTWDALGMMSAAEPDGQPVTFTHNAARQLVRRQTADGTVTNYLYDFKKLLQETDDADDPTQSYTSLDDEYGGLVSQYDEIGEGGGGPVEYYHQFDAQHSANALTDDSGSVQQTYKYQAFGLPAGTSNYGWANLTADEWGNMSADAWANLPVNPAASSVRHTYGGQAGYYADDLMGFYLLGMGDGGRYYDPAIGQFISEDPIRQAGGSLNLKEYVGNNPVTMIDPGGKEAPDYYKVIRIGPTPAYLSDLDSLTYSHGAKPGSATPDANLLSSPLFFLRASGAPTPATPAPGTDKSQASSAAHGITAAGAPGPAGAAWDDWLEQQNERNAAFLRTKRYADYKEFHHRVPASAILSTQRDGGGSAQGAVDAAEYALRITVEGLLHFKQSVAQQVSPEQLDQECADIQYAYQQYLRVANTAKVAAREFLDQTWLFYTESDERLVGEAINAGGPLSPTLRPTIRQIKEDRELTWGVGDAAGRLSERQTKAIGDLEEANTFINNLTLVLLPVAIVADAIEIGLAQGARAVVTYLAKQLAVQAVTQAAFMLALPAIVRTLGLTKEQQQDLQIALAAINVWLVSRAAMRAKARLRVSVPPGAVGSVRSANATVEEDYVNLASARRTNHILYGDGPGDVGHLWPGQPPDTTPFRQSWSGPKIMHEVSDIVTDPAVTFARPDGKTSLFYNSGKPARFIGYGVRDGVRIKVVYEPAGEGIITAYPEP